MTAPVLVSTTTAGAASGTTLTIAVPAEAADGDMLVALIRGQGVSTGTTQASCAGWTPAHAQGLDDRVHMILTHPVTASAEPASYTFATGGASGRIVGAIQVWRGVDPASPVAGFHGYAKLSGTSQTLTAWPVDSASDDLAVIGLWSDERTSGQSHVPTSIPSGWTTGVNVQSTLDASTSGSRTSIWAGYLASTGVTTIPDATLVMPSGAASPNASSIALRGLGSTPPPDTLPFRSVAHFLASPGATMAWRLGGGPYPQLSEYAADQSVARGYKALEFSCGWTSDLIPFGLGPQYLDSIAGVSGNVDPTTMTWAELSSTYVNKNNPVSPGVYQPFYRLEDALAKYAGDYIIAVDPKFGFDDVAKIDALLELCDLYGGPSRILIKFDSPTGSTNLTTRAHARGYLCMNYWDTDTTALAAQQANWDILGVAYSAGSAVFDAATSYGKPVWAAVTQTQAQYDTATTLGADFQNVSGVTSVQPVGGTPTADAVGAVASSSTTAGTATIRHGASGAVVAVTTAAGAATTRHNTAGTVAITSATMGVATVETDTPAQPWDAVHVGDILADGVYVGADKIWP